MKATLLGWGLLLLLPVGLKLSLPALATAAVQLKQTVLGQSPQPLWGVESIEQEQLTFRTPTGSTQHLSLAGIATINNHWQREATGVMAAVLAASHAQVSVSPQSSTTALVRLPNGTLLQRILLTDGVAKLDPSQLATLPADIVADLKQAQTSAQQQQKNIWGETP
jgi:hypothetical protein